jgi:protein disulfide-isomerase A6
MKAISLLLIIAILGSSLAMYGKSSKVVVLTASNFQDKVIKSKDIYLVEFYAPWCGHCKSLAPEFEKAAKALEGMMYMGAVDMTTEQSVGSPYGISGYPTLKFFGPNKAKPVDYSGARTA